MIPVYEAGEADGQLFIAMRWVEGTDLRSLIWREGRLDPDRAVAIVEQVAAALDAAHSGGLVHRDVKPANVMLTAATARSTSTSRTSGLTKRTASGTALTQTGALRRHARLHARPSRSRASRRRAGGRVRARLPALPRAHRPAPYDRDTEVAKMYAHLHDPPPSAVETAPGTPAALDAVIARALAKEADERYPSAGDLGRAARGARSEARTRRSRSAAWPPARRHLIRRRELAPGATAASPPPRRAA